MMDFKIVALLKKIKVVLPAKISQVPKNDLAKYGVAEVIELSKHFKDQNINKDEVQVDLGSIRDLC